MPWMPTTDQAWKLAPQLPLPLATQAKQPQYVFNWMPWINWNCHESTPHHLLLSTSMSNLMKVTTSSISSECRNCTHEIKGALGEPIAFLPQSNHEPINFNGETSQKKNWWILLGPSSDNLRCWAPRQPETTELSPPWRSNPNNQLDTRWNGPPNGEKKETESEKIGKLSTSCVNFNFMCGCMYRHIIDCTNTKTQRVSFFTTSVNVCSKPCHGANCHNSQPQWGQTPSTPSSQS